MNEFSSSFPLISIVTTTLNCQDEIGATAASIASQSNPHIEWIIQDGCSIDETLARAKSIYSPVNVYSEQDAGIYDAMNKAVGKCRGEWVYFLQAGDFFSTSNSLEILSSAITSDSEAQILIAPVCEVSINGDINTRMPGSILDKYLSLKDGSFINSQEYWLAGMPCHQGIIVKREVLKSIKFDTNMKVAADWDHLLKCVSLGIKVKELNIAPLSWYPNGGYSYENSDQWVIDIIEMCSKYAETSQVSQYFNDCLMYHQKLKKERRLLKNRILKCLLKK